MNKKGVLERGGGLRKDRKRPFSMIERGQVSFVIDSQAGRKWDSLPPTGIPGKGFVGNRKGDFLGQRTLRRCLRRLRLVAVKGFPPRVRLLVIRILLRGSIHCH